MHFDEVASAYAKHRGTQAHVVAELLRREAPGARSRVLEIGCGTGAHVRSVHGRTGSGCFGVDPSLAMLARGPEAAGPCFVCAAAERLPFGDASFDLAFSVNVIHHVPVPGRYFCEARRVLKAGGRICTFTDSPDMIRRRRPLSTYWPSSARADLERYPGLDALRQQMTKAGFEQLSQTQLRAPFVVTSAAPYRDRVFSCLRLIPDGEFQAGLARLESDLARGPVHGVSELIALWGSAGQEGG